MGLYARHIFPRLMEWAIGSAEQLAYRRDALAAAHGVVLELGFGTGLNLSCYPETVKAVTGLDPERMLESRVERRTVQAAMPVRLLHLDAASRLPFDSATFDTAVSTWTLCTIPDAISALRETHRVLKPEGRLLFLEHGRSEEPRVARWQDLLNPVENVVGCGCNLNRRIDVLIRQAGFKIVHLERFQMPETPRVLGEVYRGEAIPIRTTG